MSTYLQCTFAQVMKTVVVIQMTKCWLYMLGSLLRKVLLKEPHLHLPCQNTSKLCLYMLFAKNDYATCLTHSSIEKLALQSRKGSFQVLVHFNVEFTANVIFSTDMSVFSKSCPATTSAFHPCSF